jgi:hypothetical protein
MIHLLAFLLLLSPQQRPATDSVSVFARHKPFGSVLRTVRDSVHLKDDSTYQTLQIETTKSKTFNKIIVRFGIYQDGKPIFTDQWKASDYFAARDHLHDTIKWSRLEYLMKTFFINRNFQLNTRETLSQILDHLEPADIRPKSKEEDEFNASAHTIFAVYGGGDRMYGLTWLKSKGKFVRIWRN